MSNRKETPDVLGEILSSPAQSATPVPSKSDPSTPVPITVEPTAEPKATPKATPSKAKSKPKRKAPTPKSPVAKSPVAKSPIQWAYMEVIFREFRGWRPRYVDGVELDDWKEQPEIADYLNQLGQEGWEMAGIVNSRRNMRDVYFKRRVD